MQKYFVLLAFMIAGLASCKPTKQVITGIITNKPEPVQNLDSLRASDLKKLTSDSIAARQIDFRTFSAKVKVESEDAKGKNPDITALVKIVKDSAMWISLTATILNAEVYRLYVKPDSVILLDKRAHTYQVRKLDYLQEVTQIPFDFKTLQDLFVGNPVFFNAGNINVRKQDEQIMVNSVNDQFKNLLSYAAKDFTLTYSKLDDVHPGSHRTADITYKDYSFNDGVWFATKRQITVAEKTRVNVNLDFRQWEFNKELSFNFSIPKNYKKL